MEKKNILITGRKNAGKSTLVKRVIEQFQGYAGFKTVPLKNYGLISTYQMYDFINKTSIPISKYVDNKIVGIPESFSTFGKKCLKNALDSNYSLVIMDELGRFERTSRDFLYYVNEVLNSDKICLLYTSHSFLFRNVWYFYFMGGYYGSNFNERKINLASCFYYVSS